MSSTKYCSMVESVIADGGFVGLIYVALSSPALAQERVAARVKRGGHGIPNEKIATRWKRSLEYLAWFALRVSAFWIIDNSDSFSSHVPILLASGKFGCVEYFEEAAFPELKAALSMMPRRGLA